MQIRRIDRFGNHMMTHVGDSLSFSALAIEKAYHSIKDCITRLVVHLR